MATRIYTRSGDSGDTGLFGGRRVAKDDLRVEAYGAVDELNASLGVARSLISSTDTEIDALLGKIQQDLLDVGSDLATPSDGAESAGKITIVRVKGSLATALETAIDRFEAELPALRQFLLPGGHPAAAALHLSRTICRRAERRCVTLARSTDSVEAANPEVIRYLNRLSDLLFVLARTANQRNSVQDVKRNPEV
jgi:cob(I)alamin adenosyltransferase